MERLPQLRVPLEGLLAIHPSCVMEMGVVQVQEACRVCTRESLSCGDQRIRADGRKRCWRASRPVQVRNVVPVTTLGYMCT